MKALIGQVILKVGMQKQRATTVDLRKKATSDAEKAEVIEIGPKDEFDRDPNLVVGAMVLVPQTGKRRFKIDGVEYIVVHHRELQVIWKNK